MRSPLFSARGEILDRELEGLTALVCSYTVAVTTHGREGRGTGIVWHEEGLIVTNAHVARHGRLAVTLPDERTTEARLVAHDAARDLALLLVDAGTLRPAPAGDPESLRPGSLVLALGHPWGIANAMSLGVVHAVTTERGSPRWIAADLRLAPGNSGGPLVDTTGRVVGVNAMIVGGLGVAIPTNVVRRFVREVAATGALASSAAWAA
jgi:serine protease Do